MAIHIGTSGWQYDSWRGRFYPRNLPVHAWLRHYSARFPTVEVNNSFYRLPSAEAFVRWRRETPPGFVVTVKASRFITHLKRLRDPAEPAALLWSRARELRAKLGPVLFQLPPRFRADPSRLRDLLDVLPKRIEPALEFRDPSWLTDEIFSILDEHGAAFVLADRPGARVPDVTTGGWAYVRFHQGTSRGPFYERRKLERWADRLAALRVRDVYVYFNNDPEGAAIRDAFVFREMLDARGCELTRPRAPAA